MKLIQQATTYTRLFQMWQNDHVTPATGKTVTVNLSKAGAAFAAAAGTVTELSNGFYKVALTIADTGTLGDLGYNCTATGCDDTKFIDEIIAINLQDAVRAGMTALPNVVSGSAGAIPTTGTGANQIAVAAGAVTVGTNNDKTGYGLSGAERTALAGVILTDTTDTLGADIAAILTQVNKLHFNGNFVQVDIQTWLTQAVTVDPNNLPNVNALSWGAAGQPSTVDGAITPQPTQFKVAVGLGDITGTQCIFTSGALKGHRLQVLTYTPASGIVTFAAPGFTLGTTPTAPAGGDTCDFL